MDDRVGGILITGGTGFLGQALARTLLDDYHGPVGGRPVPRWRRVCIYSRSEHAQAAMLQELGADPHLRMFIGDVRDAGRLYWAMKSVDTVIHAAALKRIEVGYYNPGEMVKTNVQGSMNVVEAAIAAGVRRVVLTSSDKAYQPVSPYGLSKAMAEAIFLASNNTVGSDGPSFGVCRYGNVAGSTGSVIPTWRAQLARNPGGISITDPECTRFWMTVEQAVGLVLEAAGNNQELTFPRLRAFDLATLARAMGATGWTVTGLGHWEKKHETLIEGDSSDQAERMTIEDLQGALKYV